MFPDAVRCAYVGEHAVLSGFTLIGGSAQFSYYPDGYGGGAYCEASGVITNCTLMYNLADYGGGVYGGTLNNCTLTGNSAYQGGGSYSGTLYNCTLMGNYADDYGGGVYGGTLTNCMLTSNLAYRGGGAYGGTLTDCTLKGNSAFTGGGTEGGMLNNCIILSNSATYDGGGASGGTLNNCTLAGNSASNSGGGIAWGTLTNCVVYGNSAPSGPNYVNGSSLAYCCATPAHGGTGNIADDPLFVDAAAGNYRLRAGSPCIDRGTNIQAQGAMDLDGNPRIANGRVDMGAYEYQGVAPSPTGYWGWAAAIENGQTNFNDCATGDGYPNLLKYATGSSATVPDDSAQLMEESSDGFFRLRFNRNTNATDVTLIVESAFAATNGAPWRGIATNFHGAWGGSPNVVETGTATPVTVTVREPVPATNRYMRLRVTRP